MTARKKLPKKKNQSPTRGISAPDGKLTRLSLRNFQGHELLSVPLDPCITTIVGESDAGKSSVLRALKWLTTNRPNGKEFIRDGTDEASVRLFLGETKLGRKKGSENTYHLGDKTLKAFGTSVPEPIEKILNVGPVNFQGQHDPPFWLSLSAPDVARELNSIVDLSLMDRVMSILVKKVRKSKERVSLTRERLKQAREERESTRWAVDASKLLEAWESLQDEAQALSVEASGLRSLLQEGTQATSQTQDAADAILCGLEALSAAREWRALVEEASQLRYICSVLEIACHNEDRSRLDLERAEKNLRKAKAEGCPMCGNPGWVKK